MMMEVPDFPSADAVMDAVPGALPVTSPVELTAATTLLELAQVSANPAGFDTPVS